MSLDFKLLIDRYVGCFLIFWLNFIARFLGFVLHRDHRLEVQGNILVIKMLGGGSLVMALPALLGIRRRYPQAKIRLFTTAAVNPFAETLGVFDEILVLNDRSFAGMLISGLQCLRSCLQTDTVIDLEIYSYLSTVVSLLTGARNRLGFFFDERGFRQRLHTHRVFFQASSPLYAHYNRIATLIDAAAVTSDECAQHLRTTIGLPSGETTITEKWVAIGCGCSDLSAERKLDAHQWSHHVFAPADGKDRKIIFLGAKGDKEEAEKVIAAIKSEHAWQGVLENQCGAMPLKDSLKLLVQCEEFWGIESSLLHYARLFGIRTEAFLGPTHPMHLRPIPGLSEKIHYRRTLCSPCVHIVSKPPCHGNNLCMKWLFDVPTPNDARSDWIPAVTDTNRTDHEKL